MRTVVNGNSRHSDRGLTRQEIPRGEGIWVAGRTIGQGEDMIPGGRRHIDRPGEEYRSREYALGPHVTDQNFALPRGPSGSRAPALRRSCQEPACVDLTDPQNLEVITLGFDHFRRGGT